MKVARVAHFEIVFLRGDARLRRSQMRPVADSYRRAGRSDQLFQSAPRILPSAGLVALAKVAGETFAVIVRTAPSHMPIKRLPPPRECGTPEALLMHLTLWPAGSAS